MSKANTPETFLNLTTVGHLPVHARHSVALDLIALTAGPAVLYLAPDDAISLMGEMAEALRSRLKAEARRVAAE